ncbi:MAG: putative Ig domain-containing protein [Planctomycetaceae bacterium]|nr:putative Ig domain-containing protein [Planctomycetaceae bacterium]
MRNKANLRKKKLQELHRRSLIEKLEERRLLVSDWLNPIRPNDVNNDLHLNSMDALVVINSLNRDGQRELSAKRPALAPFMDTNGDRFVNAMDALRVINHLNSSVAKDQVAERIEGEAASHPAGFISIPMVQLPGTAGQVVPLATSLSIGREEFNELGIFVAEDSLGRVDGILPGEPGYAEAVFNSSQRRVLYSRFNTLRMSSDSNLPAASFAHVYVLQSTSDNSDPSQHLRARQVSTNLMRVGWEEHVSPFGGWTQVGDRGYDDATVDFQIGEPFDGNVEPTIRAIPNQSIKELSVLTVNAFAVDADMPDDVITYSLDFAPAGAAIDPVSGRITWTPTEVQGPGNFEFLVRATDSAGAFDTESFFVTVLEVNQSPVLQAIPNLTGRPGQLVTFQAIATDADLPRQQLTYSLLPGSPNGATVNPTTGEFRWQIPDSQASGSYPVTIRVSDNGSPVLSNTKSFTVSVGCSFDDNLSGWTVFESGGTNLGKGTVTTSGCSATIREGDSFVVGLQKSFSIPNTPTALQFTLSGPEFDTAATGFIRDAFEVALVDTDGNPLVAPFTTGRDALFNSTEGMQPAIGQGIQVDGNTVTVGLNGIPVGLEATLVFRLANDDRDKTTSVTLSQVTFIGSDLAATVPNSRRLDERQDLTSTIPSSYQTANLASILIPSPSVDEPLPNTWNDSLLNSSGKIIFETSADFQNGQSFNLNTTDVIDQLSLNRGGDLQTLPIIWISNSAEGTVSKFDTRTGKELGRYRTGAGGDNPSRIAVDSEGNAWVANRGGAGTVVKILNEGFVDRNGNGTLDSSQDFNGNGLVSLDEVMAWDANGDGLPDDERIAFVKQVGGGPRGVAIDANGKVWVAPWNGTGFRVFDNRTGELEQIVNTPHGSYGAVVDGKGNLWSAIGPGNAAIMRINTNTRTYAETVSVAGAYGLTVDRDGIVWTSPNIGTNVLSRYDPTTRELLTYPIPATSGGGITVDRQGNIWFGNHWSNQLWKFTIAEDRKTLLQSTSIEVCSQPKSASIDADGYLWTVCLGSNQAYKIDTMTNQVVPGWPIPTGAGPYNYSDMTGDQLQTVTQRSGTWTEIIDAARLNAVWAGVEIASNLPNDTSLSLRVRTSNLRDTLAAQSWLDVPFNQPLPGIVGRFLQVETRLRSQDPDQHPAIDRITVHAAQPPQVFVSQPNALLSRELGTFLLTGRAIADRPLIDGKAFSNDIVLVTVNNIPVQQLDTTGNFFTLVDVQSGINRYEVTAHDAYGQTRTHVVYIQGVEQSTIDFSRYSDITGSFSGTYFRTSFNEQAKLLHVDLATRNDGQFVSDVPLLVGVKNVSDPRVSLVGFDGFTPEGIPYYNYSAFVAGGRLGPGQLTESPTVLFHNPQRVQFDYELVFYSKTNLAPSFTSVPKIEGLVDKEYRYVVTAIDEDGDPLSFQLREAPAGMSINSQTGIVTWTPQASEAGSPRVTIEASDARGGRASQSFTLNVNVPPPNRPPVITSVPITSVSLSTKNGGKIVVSNDEWTLSNDGFIASPDARTFALNIGAYFTEGKLGKFLVYTENFGLAGSSLAQTMRDAGHTWVVDANRPFSIENLLEFDGLFLTGMPVDNDILIDYVEQGGAVYLAGGTAMANEASSWKTFLSNYGLEFENSYRTEGNIPIDDHPHPVFNNVNLLFQYVGQPIIDRDVDDKLGFLISSRNGDGLYASYDAAYANGLNYTYPVKVFDADDDGLIYRMKSAPNGMWFDPRTSMIHWSPTPDQIGDHEVEVEVSDGRGGIATQKFLVCVHPDPTNHAPIIVSDPPTVTSVTTPYSYTVQAVDADSDVLSFQLLSGPTGLSISESTGLLTWNSPAIGSHVVKVQVADGRGGFDTQGFELRVAGAGLGTIRGTKWNDINGDGAFGQNEDRVVQDAIIKATDVLHLAGRDDIEIPDLDNGRYYAIGRPEFQLDSRYQKETKPQAIPVSTGSIITLESPATGRINFYGSETFEYDFLTPDGNPHPDGGGGAFIGSLGGISLYSGPPGALLGLFLSDENPRESPPGGLDFTLNGLGREFFELKPKIGQIFFMGDGFTAAGVAQRFVAPEGATRLFMGTPDAFFFVGGPGYYLDNDGEYFARIIVSNGIIQEPTLAGWTIYLDQNQNGRLDDSERFTVTDANGNYEFTDLPAGNYYVAEVQQSGWTQTFPSQSISGAELIVGGSFEDATLEQGVSIFWKGSRLEPGWDVIEDSVDVVHRTFFISSTGNYSVDLTGTPGDGAISQTVSTVPGARYRLSFDLAGNPLAAPAIKQLLVSAGSVSRSFEFDASGFDAQSLAYRRESFEFVATSERTLIVFDSMTPGIGGPVIDSVSLRQLSQAKTHVVELGSNSIVANVNFGNSQIGSSSRSINFFSQPPLAALSNEVWLYDAIAQTSSPEAIVAYAGVSVPSGMTVHPQLGIVAWQPTSDQIGRHTVILQATDTIGNSATQVFEIEVVLPNTAPLLTVTPSTNAVATRAYESVVAAQDAEGDAILYRLVNGPTGLSLNQREVPNASGDVLRVERFLTWTPTAAQIGSHTVRIEARDARGAASELEFTIQVAATGSNRLPTITSQARKSTIVDRMYAYAPTANDLDSQRLVWSLSQAPAGMAIHPDSGFITWTPTTQQLGDHSITLSVSDGAGGEANQSFTLNVSNEFRNTAPLIVSNPRLYALEGQDFRYDVVSEDKDHDPIRYRLVVAPLGMSIDASRGTIRWTPNNQQFGEHFVVIEASDPYGAIGTQRFTVNVNCVNSPPMIVSVPLTTALTERTYIYPVRATDLESGPLRFKLLSSPTGMSINADTGLIRWNPSTQQLGEHTVTVEVTDEAGAVGLQVYKIVVRSSDEPVDPNNPDGPKLGNRAPLFTSTPVFNAKSGVVYQYTVSAIDPDRDAISFALQNPPAGMTISASGVITWAPALGTNGTYPITISATDVHGARTNQAFALNVAANSAPVITSQPVTNVAAGAIYRYAVRVTDADDDPLAYVLEGAPDGMSIDRLGLIRWETKQSDLGTKSFTVRVTDSFGQSATQAVSLIVAADTTGPAVSISVFGGRPDRSNGMQVDLGSTYTVQVQATDDVGVVSRSLKVNGIEQPLSSSFAVQLVGNQLGIVELRGAARDAAGNETTYNLSITIVDPASVNLIPNDPTAPPRNGGSDPNDKRAPFVDITSPELGASVTNVVTIRGTVDDPEDRLWYWRLYYARMDQISTAALDLSDTDWVMIRQGTTEVINGELGQFDPTMLSRDGYVIALVAYDLNGAGEIVGTVVNVEGNLQVGNFRLEFTDVTIPLAGIPITINRVYDTVNANDEQDFGFGWSFGVQDPRILEAGALGQGGGLNFSTDRFIPDKTKVFLTNPEGRRVGFTYREELVSASLFGGIFRPYFVADPGVYDTLTIDETQVARGGIIGSLAQGINPDNYTLTTKSGMKYRYNQNAGLQTITDRNGNVVTFADIEIRHSLGQTIQLVRDHRNRIREIVLPSEGNQTARKLIYTYDASGNLVRFTDQTGLVTRYEYLSSPAHYLDKVYDPLGKKVSEAIYENRRFIGMFDALGNEVGRQTIDTARNRGVVRDANGFETVLIYNDRGNVIEEIDPLGFKTIRRYEDPRNVDLETTIIDRNGNVTNREYDSRGNATRIIERGPQSNPLARPVITEFTYDSSNNVTSIKNSAGATTAFAFDASGQVTRIANALAATSGFTYDSQGRRQSFTDFNGNTTRFEYDEACPCGSPSRLINPDGTYQTFEYNDYGQVTAERTFEANGTLVEQKLTEYDAAGKVTREVMGASNDPLHPPSEIRKFYSGNLLDWEIIVNPVSLNADGSLKESPSTPVAQRKSRITDYVYDAADRLIRQIDANGGVVNFRYDAQGNRLLLQDPVGNITTWVYDGNNRMIEERDPLYWDKYIRANPVDFAGKVGDALLDQVIIANRLASGASLANNQGAPHVRSFGYDPNGNQIDIIDRNNRRREFSYDHAGRMIEERWYAENNGPLVETIRFSFDILGNMLTAENSVSKYTYTYDILNRLKSVDNLDSNPDTPHVILYYDYDSQGNVLRTYDDSGVTVESTYDGRNQLATRKWFDAVVPAGQTPDVADARVGFSYNAAGRQKQIRRYSDLTATTKVGTTDTSHDLAGRTNTLIHRNATDTLLSSYDYGYDFSGLVIDEQRDHQDPQHRQSITYNYDLTGQLVDAFFSGQDDEHYEYDLNGNRTRSVVGSEVRNYTTGVGNRLLSDGVSDYEYDGEGNLISRKSKRSNEQIHFTVNHTAGIVTSHSTELNLFEGDIEYSYDAFNRRYIRSVSSGSDQYFLFNGSDHWLISDDIGKRFSIYSNKRDQLLANQEDGLNQWALTDLVGTLRDKVDSDGVVTESFKFTSFGALVDGIESKYSIFAGRDLDPSTGLIHFRSRDYDPKTGVFASPDSIGFSGRDANLRRFVFNSPANFMDPTGNTAISTYAFVSNVSMNDGAMANLGLLGGISYSTFKYTGYLLTTGSQAKAVDLLMSDLSNLLVFEWALSSLSSISEFAFKFPVPVLGQLGAFVNGVNVSGTAQSLGISLLKEEGGAVLARLLDISKTGIAIGNVPKPFDPVDDGSIGGVVNGARWFIRLLGAH